MANLPMEEDKWGDIAVNDPARRANYSGVTGAQTGYCTDTLDEHGPARVRSSLPCIMTASGSSVPGSSGSRSTCFTSF